MAAFIVLVEGNFINQIKQKEQLLLQHIKHPTIKDIRTAGLWMAIEFDSYETNYAVIKKCIANGLISDWFLFNNTSMRIAPPLIITTAELVDMCNLIVASIIEVTGVSLTTESHNI